VAILDPMQEFRDCLSVCELHDMGFSGEKFTCRRAEVCEKTGHGHMQLGTETFIPFSGSQQ
jgi:hypothetical protein